jgi:negative regulator of sigma-B (phosphoserine phosphatase)
VKWSTSIRTVAREGEALCGDAALVQELGEFRRIALIDALGHGPTAASVASLATEHLESVPLETPVADVMRSLHDALRGTRGAAATILRLVHDVVEGCGIGNVELRSHGMVVPTVLTGGIIGVRFGSPRVFRGTARPGGRVIMFSDGISSRVPLSDLASLNSAAMCDAIFSNWRKAHDDACVVVAEAEVTA